MSSTSLSRRDLQRLTLAASDVDQEYTQKLSQKAVLHDLSLARYTQWGNTVDSMRIKKEQDRIQRLAVKEAAQLLIDADEHRIQEALRCQAIERAERLVYERTDKVRIFRSGMQESDVLQEREAHERLRNIVKRNEKMRDTYHQTEVAAQQAALLKKEVDEKQVWRDQEHRVARDQLLQLKEYQQRHMETMKENAEAGERMKRDIAMRKEEDERKAERLKTQARISNSENVEKNRALQQLKVDAIAQERLSDEKIQLFAREKEDMVIMRKQKEAERFKMKMDQRQQLIDSQTKVLLSLKDGETQRLGGQIRDVELKAESREKDEQLKRDQLKNSIAISRQRALDRKQRLLNEKRTEEARFAAKWRQSMQQLEEEDVQAHANVFQNNLKEQDFLKVQMAERDAAKTKLKGNRSIAAAEMTAEAAEEKRQFDAYADQMVAEYAAKGRNMKPLMLQLAKAGKSVLM